MVAEGKGFSWCWDTALQQQQKGVRMMKGTYRTRSQPTFNLPLLLICRLFLIMQQPSFPYSLLIIGILLQSVCVFDRVCKSQKGVLLFIIFYLLGREMFKSLLGKVMSKIADFSPVRNLIKYILDRTLNQFLSDQIQIDDFKDVGDGKVLTLTNIALNQDKINRESLLSSPYILHAGTMGKLNIKLPNLSELATKSIEISADRLVLDLKPNKQFAENFKEAMKEQQQNVIIEQMEEPGEIRQSSPLDFFRQLVKQMLLNIVIKFENVIVRLFINEPSEHNTNKPQYYLMFRIPLLTLGKSEEAPPQQENVDKVRFDALLPQCSLHLLREGVKYPEFANEKAEEGNFPFTYPSLKHPGTLLVMGKSDLSKETAAKLRLTLTTNYTTEKKELNIEGGIGSIEATVDPIQLKILSRFVAQLKQFQKVFKSVMIELDLIPMQNYGMSRQSIDFTLSRTSSGGGVHKSTNIDFFSSMVMSISEPNRPSHKQMDFYSSIATKPELRDAANNFNQTAAKELASNGEELPQGYKNINFKQDLLMGFTMKRLHLNFLKYVPQVVHARGWSIDGAMEHVNTSLSCSHYRGEMRDLNYSFSTADNKHTVTMKFVTLHDVKLPRPTLTHVHPSQEFYDIDSSTYYSQNVNQDYFTSQPDLLEFHLTEKQHYCMQQLLRVSDGACPNLDTESIKRYSFMPEHAVGEGEGLTLIFNSHKKLMKIEVKEVAVMANFEIWKDTLNIIFPIFLYKQLVEKTNISGEAIRGQEEQESQQMKFNPFESAYIFTGDIVEEIEGKEQPVGLLVQVGLIYCMYRQTSAVGPKQNLITQVESKVHDYDNFSHNCFCGLTERALYAQVFGFKFQKERDNMNMEIKEVKAGFITLQNSHTSDHGNQAFLIVEGSRYQELHYQSLVKGRVYAPRAKFNLQLSELVTFVDMMKKVAGTIDSLLMFQKNLSAKIVYIDLENGTLKKEPKQKMKKERIIEVFSDQISLKMIILTTCIKSLYLRKEGKSLDVRINSLAVGLIDQLRTSLAQIRNQIMLNTYPSIQTFEGIDDTALILELGRLSSPIKKTLYKSDIKSKLTRKLDFFEKLSEETYSLAFLFNQKTEVNNNKYSQKQFRFNKNPKRESKNPSVIDEEKHCQCIDVLLACPLYLYLGNAAFLARQTTKIEDIKQKVTGVLESIKKDSEDIMRSERKDSVESFESEPAEILFKIKGGDIILDLRPQFSYDPKQHHRILSNTRLIVKVSLNKFEVTLCPEIKHTKIDVSVNLELFFLHHRDRDVEVNPVFILEKNFKSLGFRSIATLGELVLKGDHSGLRQVGTFQVGIDDIKLNLCISTIPYLELFWEHFLKHSISGDFGIEQTYFEVLQEEIEELQILTTEKIQELQNKIEIKKITQKRFEAADFMAQVEPSLFKGIFLKKIIVDRIRMDLYGGHQFKFVECNSLHQSKPTIRTCSEQPDYNNFVSLMMDKFAVQASIAEETRTLVEFQRLDIDYSFKRIEGLMWKNEKSYNMSLVRIQKPLRVLMHIGTDYFQVKLNHLDLSIGVTDQLLTLGNYFTQESQQISKSGWKLAYLQEKKVESKRTILVIAPAGLPEGKLSKINLSVEFKNNQIFSDQTLHLHHLFIHEPLSNSARINLIIEKWIKDVLMSNLGNLVTGAFSQVIYKCVELLISAIRHIVGFFFTPIRE